MTPPPNAQDNFALRTWPSPEPQYENWYSLVNHPTRRFSFWFRYTLVSTSTGVRECRVWAIPVDADDPKATRVYTQPLPQDAFKQELPTWKVTLGNAGIMEHGRMQGRVVDQGATVEWDFSFAPSTFSLVPVRSPLVRKLISSSSTRSPNSSVRMTGSCSVNGQRVDFKDATGHQGHTEGSRMQPVWVWGRAGGFEQDADAFFEGVSSMRGGKAVCAFHVGAHGQRFHLNAVKHLKGRVLGLLGPGNQSTWSPGQWNMSGEESGRKITATLNAVGMEPVKVRYLDTDGRPKFNCMYALASCALSLTPALQGSNASSTLLAKNRANMEFVASEPVLGRPDEFLPLY